MKLLTTAEVCDRLGIRRTTFYALRSAPEFPRPIEMTKRTIRYRENELDAWLESKRMRAA